MKKRSDSEPVYNGKYLKTEIKFYEGLINTNFHGGKVPQEGYQWICLSIILIDSIFSTIEKTQVIKTKAFKQPKVLSN